MDAVGDDILFCCLFVNCQRKCHLLPLAGIVFRVFRHLTFHGLAGRVFVVVWVASNLVMKEILATLGHWSTS